MGTFVLFWMYHLLKGISRLFTNHTSSFGESSIADEMWLTETIAELILSDFGEALLLLTVVDYR